jgi:hypothetical protein
MPRHNEEGQETMGTFEVLEVLLRSLAGIAVCAVILAAVSSLIDHN